MNLKNQIKRGLYQYQGPSSEYHLPKKPRFRFEEKLYQAVSLDPDIEVVDTYVIGLSSGITHKKILLKVKEKYLALNAVQDRWYDHHGKVVLLHNEATTSKPKVHLVWKEVEFTDLHKIESRNEVIRPEAIDIPNITDDITSIAMEYLATDRHNKIHKSVKQIHFSDKVSISPKRWEVIQND